MSVTQPSAPSPAIAPDSAKSIVHPPATPMMAQFIEIKAANPDSLLFYRMGDFYELFLNDAEIASRALGIVLTKRGKYNGVDIPMCGVPIDRADDYLHRLISLGHRVAVCEQMEDPAEARKRGAKSVVRRDVVRLVTPGTITEDRLLDPAQPNYLAAISRVRSSDDTWTYAIAAADISTGSLHVVEADLTGLASELARFDPREIVAAEALCDEPDMRALFQDARVPLTPFAARNDGVQAERRLCDYFGLSTLDGLGITSRAEIAALAALILYVERTQISTRPQLSMPARWSRSAVLEIDAATRANLELTRTMSGQRDGSLLSSIDLTMTPVGGRLLAERLAGPLTDPVEIASRQDAIAYLVEHVDLRAALRADLRSVPDIARALSRIAMARGGPRDLAALRDGLTTARILSGRLDGLTECPNALVQAANGLAGLDPALEAMLADALNDELPLNRRDGHFIRSGFEPALDELRALRDDSRRVVASLQANYSELAQTKQLRIKHNNFLGYFIEVSQAQGEIMLRPPMNMHFIHRQTMADAMRFSTSELAELEAKISSAADRALALEFEIFDRLLEQIGKQNEAIRTASHALANLDVTAALAELAVQRDWVRPQIDLSLSFQIEAGRHPVVEAALRTRGTSFIANGADLSGEADGGRIALVTGPNMAGKSTYLRQNALIVVLAQMGAFVPASRAHIGIVDRLFSRVGAADDLARGRSTFMVEMVETAAILNQATERSLVILDEIGRGTATFDGLSIAWASVEHLHNKNRARALFATHFHELTHLAGKLPRLINLTMRVSDWKGSVVFLHEVMPGAADRSYGIQVAKLAGLPNAVVERAEELLIVLEANDRKSLVKDMVNDLPLFSAAISPPAPKPRDKLRDELALIDPDTMSPRDALDALYRLKSALR